MYLKCCVLLVDDGSCPVRFGVVFFTLRVISSGFTPSSTEGDGPNTLGVDVLSGPEPNTFFIKFG